jgi:hypothetical protein
MFTNKDHVFPYLLCHSVLECEVFLEEKPTGSKLHFGIAALSMERVSYVHVAFGNAAPNGSATHFGLISRNARKT